MSDEFSESKPKLPSHIVYRVEEGSGDKNHWHKIGAAWSTVDGGLSIKLTAIPLDGRIALRPREALERMREERKARQEQGDVTSLEPTQEPKM